MIYYDIQHHGNIERLQWLGSMLDAPDNIINFSLDVDADIFRDFEAWASKKELAATISFNRSLPVTWCGPSMLTLFRDNIERALSFDGWEYFINLSGVCFPTASQSQIKKVLLQERIQNNKTSFCYGFIPKREPIWILNTNRDDAVTYHDQDFYRLNISCTQRIADAFKNEALDPVMNVMHRKAICVDEDVHKKHLIFRGLEPWEARDRMAFWNDNDYVVGRAWFILHRKQVEWLAQSPFLRTMHEQLLHTFCPDETFIPSMLFSRHNPYRDEVSKNNFRYQLGAPSYIGPEQLDPVFDSGCFFARKLSKNIGQKGLQKIEEHISHQ